MRRARSSGGAAGGLARIARDAHNTVYRRQRADRRDGGDRDQRRPCAGAATGILSSDRTVMISTRLIQLAIATREPTCGDLVMSNKMWGGRFGAEPDAIMADINTSIDVDRKLFRQDIAASRAHAEMLAAAGHHSGAGCADDRSRSRHDPVRDRGRHVRVQARARRHPHERRGAARRTDRPGGRAAAHRALAQRPGRDRLPPVGARRHRRPRREPRRLSARARRAGAGPCRRP